MVYVVELLLNYVTSNDEQEKWLLSNVTTALALLEAGSSSPGSEEQQHSTGLGLSVSVKGLNGISVTPHYQCSNCQPLLVFRLGESWLCNSDFLCGRGDGCSCFTEVFIL